MVPRGCCKTLIPSRVPPLVVVTASSQFSTLLFSLLMQKKKNWINDNREVWSGLLYMWNQPMIRFLWSEEGKNDEYSLEQCLIVAISNMEGEKPALITFHLCYTDTIITDFPIRLILEMDWINHEGWTPCWLTANGLTAHTSWVGARGSSCM